MHVHGSLPRATMDRGGMCRMHIHLLRPQRSRQPTFFSNTLSILLFFISISLIPAVSHAQCSSTVGCFPPIGNLATGRTIQTDSQCSDGDNFCIHGTTDCSNACNPSIHSIDSINDGNTGTAWISTIGPSGTNATLQLDFVEPVLFDRMSILWKSPRPRSMVLERSHDHGVSWLVYRYYSSSCQTDFQLMPMITVPSIQLSSTAPICTASQSSILGSTNEEVTFATSEHLLDASMSDTMAYTHITNLRVRLLAQFDLGPNPGYQYYSVGEWVVNGSCVCNGHADTCAPAPGGTLVSDKVYSGCMCEHNTEGTHCDSCTTGFNAVQWSAGTDLSANACQRCECNGHAEDCTSENPEEGTQCIDCTDNTEGNNCERCKIGFYENSEVLSTDPNICLACACNVAGITDSGECSGMGQCNCKTNVAGLQCSECVTGYWNLTSDNELGCRECDCDPRGTLQSTSDPAVSLCDQITGRCQCLENVGGNSCNICDDGFYSLEDGCLPCGCNIAGSTSPVCDKDSRDGQCPCFPNVDTPTCTVPLPGYYFRHLEHELFEAEYAELSEGVTQVYPEPDSDTEYTGGGLVVFPASGTATFHVQVPRDYRYEIILRLQPPTIVDGVNIFIESQSPVHQGLNCSPVSGTITSSFLLPSPSATAADYLVVDTVCLVAGVVYSVQVEHLGIDHSQWMLDSLLLLPDFSSGSAYYAQIAATDDASLLELCLPRSVTLGGVREECRDIVFALSVEFYGQVFECDCNSSEGVDASVVCATYGGQCSCLDGVTGLQCDECMNGWFNLTTSGCTDCGCDIEGSTSAVCDTTSGQCNCRPNVQGLMCDNCIHGYFNLTSTGCFDCNCSKFSISPQCSEQGQCPCNYGIGGTTCDQCQPGFYNISSSGCTACNCSSVGVRSSSNTCDTITGQCPCIGNTVSRDCLQCPMGFFETNSPNSDACVECVCSNRSNTCSDDSASFQAAAVQSDFTEMCAQSPVDCNDGWQLLTATGRTAAPFGPSDANGLGYILLSNDNPMMWAPSKFLGNQQSSYGLDFIVSVSLSSTERLKDATLLTLYSVSHTLVGTFSPPAMHQDSLSLNTILTYTLPLVEDYWHVDSSTGPPATFYQLYSTLSNLTALSFSAEFRQDFIEFVYVQRVQLLTRVPPGTLATDDLVLLNTSFPVELCVCPTEYSGRSCELCARGHARPSGDIGDPCVECNCNDLSLDCDVDTAVCINCSGNSEGENCERCQSGYYGDPIRGIPCLLCQCPTLDRSFSPTCFLDSDLNATCDSCSIGYTGRNCEMCMDGFFGNPMVGQCITCECNDNVDPSLGPVCDMDTGRCLNCLNNTIGFECQFCQPGYYGDPPSSVPCTPCECHPNGTLGVCSSLFGTCTCASDSVLGALCDECQDGYWGLSRGLPCIPCDCCTNGSSSAICDKETGRCDCHTNVGSEEDDKCCSCTPGFFNFTPDGCQACGCSELSVSEECDITSGQCECQEGAIGLKCDDCAFGFTGIVPDCTPCHPCFLQWYEQIQQISEMAAVLKRRADFLVDGYYNGYTVESIEADIQALLDQLASTNASLQNITLQTSSVQQLQDILSEINATLAEMDELTIDTEQQLVTARRMIETVAAFDGTVNQTSVDELLQQITFYNSTIANLLTSARQLLDELQLDELQATSAWTDITAVEVRVQALLTNYSIAETDVITVEGLLSQLELQRVELRQNLSQLSLTAGDLLVDLAVLNSSVVDVSRDSNEAYTNIQALMANLTILRLQTDNVLGLARQLNASVQMTRVASQMLVQNTTTLLGLLNTTQQAALDISEDVASGLGYIEELITRLESTKILAGKIFNVSLPALNYVEELARNINASILSDEQVQEIATNATASHDAALQALELARNASETVRTTQSLINQLKSDISATEIAQDRVEATLSQLRENINSSIEQLEQVRYRAEAVNSTFREVQSIVENTSSVIDSATLHAMELRNRSRELQSQASADEQRSITNEDNADRLVSALADLQATADTHQAQSVQDVHNATNILTNAQQLHNNTNQTTVQQLQELLLSYVSEREAISDLRERVNTLQAELRNLTSTFTQAAQTLNECYKTP